MATSKSSTRSPRRSRSALTSPKHRLTSSLHSARANASSSVTRRRSSSRFRRELGNRARPYRISATAGWGNSTSAGRFCRMRDDGPGSARMRADAMVVSRTYLKARRTVTRRATAAHDGEALFQLLACGGGDGVCEQSRELRRPLVARTDLLFQRFQDQSIPADAKRLRAHIDPLEERVRDVDRRRHEYICIRARRCVKGTSRPQFRPPSSPRALQGPPSGTRTGHGDHRTPSFSRAKRAKSDGLRSRRSEVRILCGAPSTLEPRDRVSGRVRRGPRTGCPGQARVRPSQAPLAEKAPRPREPQMVRASLRREP